ncbi:MAG TPA: glucan 1,4-alpha-glucosidase [Balneolaceae bacterium]|nr:glucan 1,4-alpha-glucosidase [Balneolaceae bacterium]|tara:strand:+ start:64828 stop:67425 length:2598 start_codon:yes stop_codon:yes gene_type:complete
MRFNFIGAIILLLGSTVVAQEPAYLNTKLSFEERAEDLISRMTLEEKVSQMLDQAPAIERLGIHEYNWWNEALHGVARSGLATSYPQAIGLAATWNEDLIFEMATAISDEARAKHHEYARNGTYHRYQGLTIWSPNINIFRDPRWGRGQETYGEDPFLTGRIAYNFIQGLQGDDPEYLKTVATVKHFAVHSGPEPERHEFNAVVGERDFWETYMPMFETGIVDGGAYSLMCAYNRVNGEAACASDELLMDILRDRWNFDGFVVSDCWALNDIHNDHALAKDAVEASAMALRSGTDLECGTSVYTRLAEAVEEGYITEKQIDVSLKRLFTARFKLGMFDSPEEVAYQSIPYSVVDSDEHKELALKVARESIVLLKNEGVLPLRKDLKKIAVIGPNADQELIMLGNYNGMPSEIVTPLEGIKEAVSKQTEVLYSLGSELVDEYPVVEPVNSSVFRTLNGNEGLTFTLSSTVDSKLVTVRTVTSVAEDWGENAPHPELDEDSFIARWTGKLLPEATGEYKFQVSSTLKFEVLIDGEVIVNSENNWGNEHDFPAPETSEFIYLEKGKTYDFKIEAEDSKGDAQLFLEWARPANQLRDQALEMAKDADAVIFVMGLTPRLEGEEMAVDLDGFRGGDRTDIKLPEAQMNLMKEIHAFGKPTVLVLLNGSALALPWAKDHIPAIVEGWYGGQAGGEAIADVLFGDYNPAGRLPVTFYNSVEDLPPFEEYAMANRTYRYFEGDPQYPFGHGLSFTSFSYGELKVSNYSLIKADSVKVSVEIKNTGEFDGDEVVQLYVSFPGSKVKRPIKDLRGFRRIHLKKGESKHIEFLVYSKDLRYWDPDKDKWIFEVGPVEILVGSSSEDIRQRILIEAK